MNSISMTLETLHNQAVTIAFGSQFRGARVYSDRLLHGHHCALYHHENNLIIC